MKAKNARILILSGFIGYTTAVFGTGLGIGYLKGNEAAKEKLIAERSCPAIRDLFLEKFEKECGSKNIDTYRNGSLDKIVQGRDESYSENSCNFDERWYCSPVRPYDLPNSEFEVIIK